MIPGREKNLERKKKRKVADIIAEVKGSGVLL
jgi:hypothetical protein